MEQQDKQESKDPQEEEERLRDRLQSKKQEERLRDKLRSKKQAERRPSDNGHHQRHRIRDHSSERRYDRRRDDRRGPPSRGHYGPPDRYGRHDDRMDRYGGPYPDRFGRYPPRSRSPPRRSRSHHRSRSREGHRSRSRSRDRYNSRHRRSRSSSYSDSSTSSGSSSSTSQGSVVSEDKNYTKDQRTVFINQLVMRANERDLRKFFKRHHLHVQDISMLRDKRSGKHKGFAYVELKKYADVAKAVALSDQPPDFQRFPLVIKANQETQAAEHTPTQINNRKLPPLKTADGKILQAQKVYVGNLDVGSITAQHLQSIFQHFGHLEQINLHPGKGFAFLQFHDPKEAALALQSMSGQNLLGRPIKTNWATNQIARHNTEIVTADEFPPDATTRIQNALMALGEIQKPASAPAVAPVFAHPPAPSNRVATVAEARASLANPVSAAPVATATPIAAPSPAIADDPKVIGNADSPTNSVLVHNMYNKDEETEVGWENEIKLEFTEECSKYGTIQSVIVLSRDVGGKICATFTQVDGAQKCAQALAGRWFDKRQLRVEFVPTTQVNEYQAAYPVS